MHCGDSMNGAILGAERFTPVEHVERTDPVRT
jgi:hypothetical protein